MTTRDLYKTLAGQKWHTLRECAEEHRAVSHKFAAVRVHVDDERQIPSWARCARCWGGD